MKKILKIRGRLCLILLLLLSVKVNAGINSDSTELAATLKQLLKICSLVDFADPNVQTLGNFYKAAPYIVYRGEDLKRKWKDVADYSNENEKKQVDAVCEKINSTVNQDSAYKISGYLTRKESEGIWHVLFLTYNRKGKTTRSAFAFLRIKQKFALGDID